MVRYYRYYLKITHQGGYAPPESFRTFLLSQTKKYVYRIFNFDSYKEIHIKLSLEFKCEEEFVLDEITAFFADDLLQIEVIYPKGTFGRWGISDVRDDFCIGVSQEITKETLWLDLKEPDYKWQKDFYHLISQTPDDRRILNIVNKSGGIGKTSLLKYLLSHDLVTVVPCTGSVSQMAAFLDKNWNKKVYILDMPRVRLDKKTYQDLALLLESLKNGILTSTMYGGTGTKLMNSPWVFIFSNEEFPMEYFSLDRRLVTYVDTIEDSLGISHEMDGLD